MVKGLDYVFTFVYLLLCAALVGTLNSIEIIHPGKKWKEKKNRLFQLDL